MFTTTAKIKTQHPAARENNFGLHNAPLNIGKDETGLVLQIVLPGISKEQINLHTENNRLKLSVTAPEKTNTKWNHVEFHSLHGERNFKIDERYDASAIKAGYKDGILSIVLPFSEVYKPRQIEVTVK